jgi:hypothetical protein
MDVVPGQRLERERLAAVARNVIQLAATACAV